MLFDATARVYQKKFRPENMFHSMVLHFRLVDEIYKVLSKTGEDRWWNHHVAAPDGLVVVSLDERNIGTFRYPYNEQPLSQNEIIMRYRVRNGAVKFATNAYFFQEGHDKDYVMARYGQFRVDNKGELLLVALYDKDLKKLQRKEKELNIGRQN